MSLLLHAQQGGYLYFVLPYYRVEYQSLFLFRPYQLMLMRSHLLQGVEHNDAVDALTLAAETLGLAPPPEEEKPPIGFRENLREALIKGSFKRALANALKE